LNPHRSGYRLSTLAALALLMLTLSGCASGVHATSWTGLTVSDDLLYLADLTQVKSLNSADASVVWSFPADPSKDPRGVFYITPIVYEDRVFVASEVPPTGMFSRYKHVLWALRREDGIPLWSFDIAAGPYVESGAPGGSLFVIGNSDGSVYALDVDSGTLRWSFSTGHRVWASPLIISDTVYIGSMDRNLYALSLRDGKERWRFHAGGAFAATPALWNDTLYIGAFDDRFYAIDMHTGRERWNVAGENWFWGNPVVHNGTVYAVDVNGNVYALDATSGAQTWKRALDVPVRAGPAISSDGSRLLLGGRDGVLYALDAADGITLWSQKGEGQILSTPVVSGNVVYALWLYGPHRLRAFHTDNGREIWAYPPAQEK